MTDSPSVVFRDNLFSDFSFAITGANGGIGRATAILLSSLGAKLILIGKSHSKLQELSCHLVGDSCTVVADLSDQEVQNHVFEMIPESFLPIDGFFNCASYLQIKPLKLYKTADFIAMFGPSAQFPLRLGAIASKERYFSSGSSIILMSSVASLNATSGLSVYSASKSAVNSICKSLALELATRQIRVNAILAGAVDTGMHRKITSSIPKSASVEYEQKHLLGIGKPVDIANLAAFLCPHLLAGLQDLSLPLMADSPVSGKGNKFAT